jgi:hypothetical protein
MRDRAADLRHSGARGLPAAADTVVFAICEASLMSEDRTRKREVARLRPYVQPGVPVSAESPEPGFRA